MKLGARLGVYDKIIRTERAMSIFRTRVRNAILAGDRSEIMRLKYLLRAAKIKHDNQESDNKMRAAQLLMAKEINQFEIEHDPSVLTKKDLNDVLKGIPPVHLKTTIGDENETPDNKDYLSLIHI